MNINDVKEGLPYMMKARIPILLIGQHGVGKTQGVRDFCKDRGYHLVIKNLSSEEVGDLKGLAEFERDSEGKAVSTLFAVPKWAADIVEFCHSNPDKHAVIFLDEFNRARRDVLQTIFPLLTENRLNEKILPPNCYVMAAMNPDVDGYIVTDVNEKALMDRFCHIKITSSYQDFLEYGRGAGINTKVLSFINSHPAMLRGDVPEFDLKYVQPSDRSVTWMARLQDMVDKKEMPERFFKEFAQGIVGLEASTAYLSYLTSSEKPVEGKDIAENYDKVRATILKQVSPAVYRTDLVNDSKEQLIAFLKDNSATHIEREDVYNNVASFLVDLPAELATDALDRLFVFGPFVDRIAYDTKLETKFKPIAEQIKKSREEAKQKENV